jgi:hypothetical protein
MIPLAILIPTIQSRSLYLDRLTDELLKQIRELNAHELVHIETNHGPDSIGKKRNELIDAAGIVGAKYVAFIDDDDMPGHNYIRNALEACESNKDCASLTGAIYFGKRRGKMFFHSIKYNSWYEDGQGYYRCPNHLNIIKLEHYNGIRFEEKNFGEDGMFSMALKETGRLKTEFTIAEIMYYYFTGEKDFNWQNKIYQQI